ncbi:MAG: hypothetical protein ACD_74C00150G0001 [uncultured bacterium]|nr:MAG: hypothetical protein ACD_74C00150G0001 [uncultured bacterium]
MIFGELDLSGEGGGLLNKHFGRRIDQQGRNFLLFQERVVQLDDLHCNNRRPEQPNPGLHRNSDTCRREVGKGLVSNR